MNSDRQLVPTAFVVRPVDAEQVVKTLSQFHRIDGIYGTIDEEGLEDDELFSEGAEFLSESLEKARAKDSLDLGAVIIVVNIHWDRNEDEWFDAELVGELNSSGIPVWACYPTMHALEV